MFGEGDGHACCALHFGARRPGVALLQGPVDSAKREDFRCNKATAGRRTPNLQLFRDVIGQQLLILFG